MRTWRSLGVVVMVLAMLAFVAVSFADQEASSTKRVVASVKPNIGVGAANPTPAEIQTGRFNIKIPYRIDANTQFIKITVVVTNLYKADDPNSQYSIPPSGPSSGRDGVGVVPANGNESGGAGDNFLLFTGSGDIGAFRGRQTETGTFESSQRGVFSQDVIVTAWWLQNDPEFPIGDYSGFVKLTAAVVP